MTVETERYPAGVSNYTPMGYRVKRDIDTLTPPTFRGDLVIVRFRRSGSDDGRVAEGASDVDDPMVTGATWRHPISSNFTQNLQHTARSYV